MNTQQKPKISIIVPIFSAEKYLANCIESLINQTHSNIEIILVNDGSTDKSGELCEKYASIDERITVIHKENGGVSSARNAGLDIATGEWIGFVDADDIAEPDMYEYLLNAAIENGADIVQCAIFFDNQNRTDIICSPSTDIIVRSEENMDSFFFSHLSGGTSCKLYERDLIRSIRYNESFPIGEDMRFNLDALMRSKCTVLCAQPKYHYVQHPESACNSAPTREKLTSYNDMLALADKEFSSAPSIAEFIKAEKVRNAMHVCSQIAKFKVAGCDDIFTDMQDMLRQLFEFISSSKAFTAKEKFKARLIIKHPGIYKFLIGKVKK